MIDRYLADVEAHLKTLRSLIAHETLTVERPEGIAESAPVNLLAVLNRIRDRLSRQLTGR